MARALLRTSEGLGVDPTLAVLVLAAFLLYDAILDGEYASVAALGQRLAHAASGEPLDPPLSRCRLQFVRYVAAELDALPPIARQDLLRMLANTARATPTPLA